MKQPIISILSFCAIFLAGLTLFSSCESCVRSAAKKATSLAINAAEGVSETVSEHEEKAGEKITDALGALAKGTGKSIERQLNEHAEHVATVAGRTFVQSIDGLEKGMLTEYYESVPFTADLPSGVSLETFGRIKDNGVFDAYFIVTDNGVYETVFEFLDSDGNVLMTRNSEMERSELTKIYLVVSFAFNNDEDRLFEQSDKVRITVSKK